MRGKKIGKKIGPRVNREITARECRLAIDGGENKGIVPIEEARAIAEELGFDLVEISPNARPPVIKAIDYGKYKYNQQKKVQEAKKKQVVVQLKEIQFRPNIEEHDLETKLKKVEKFLGQGDKVKMVMQFRGREMAYREQGFAKFKAIIKRTEEEYDSLVENPPKMMGNRIITILAPVKKKVAKTKKEESPKKVKSVENQTSAES